MNKKKEKKQSSLALKFFKIVVTILVIYFIALAGYIAHTYLNSDSEDDYFSQSSGMLTELLTPKLPERTNFLLLGVDKGIDSGSVRTDTMMIASYNSVNGKLSLISIPRDTLVSVPNDRWEVMCENIPELKQNYSQQTKINGIYNYSGEEHRYDYTVLQVEELMGISIDYYVKFDTDAFKYIVDSIGGIDYDVPMDMYYNDPTQDLYIDLKAGLQHLDGDKAEQLLRFRKGYAQQDLGRIETQQNFMKVFAKTALSKDNIMSNPSAYITAVLKYVDTDLKLTDSVKYIKCLSDFNAENIENYTLPGEAKMINGLSYYVADEEKMAELVYKVFTASSETTAQIDAFGKSIQILNGGYKSGFAMSKKIKLENDGYTVTSIADSPYDKEAQTKIYVSENGYGNDLVKYFDNAEVIVYPDKTGEYDIVIVTGSDEKTDEEKERE